MRTTMAPARRYRSSMTFEALPHDRIPESCTCQWIPVGGGLWERTGKTFPGLPQCSFDHEAARLRGMTVVELRALARGMGLSSTTRLENRGQLARAIGRMMQDSNAGLRRDGYTDD